MPGQPEDTFDVIVIGAGPPGENAAQYAIKGSDRTAALVERELVGGECSYWACVPSKALLRPVDVLDAARALPGIRVDGLDPAAVLKRRDWFVGNQDDGSAKDDGSQVKWANDNGVEVVRGHGRLAGARTVEVTSAGGATRTLQARRAVVVATGSSAVIPPTPGLREALPWTSRDVTNLHEVPRRVVIIGGGVVACEAAVWLRGLGAEEVTVVVRGGGLLARNEPFAGQLVADRFAALGIRVLLRTSVDAVSRPAPAATGEGHVHGGPVEVTLGGGETVVADEIVVAAGRVPNSRDVGLDTVGLQADGALHTDDHMAVTGVDGDWLYAVGDVTGRALLTHMGKYQARIAGWVIGALAEGRDVGGQRYRDIADRDMVPQVAFTDPQVASVGLTEAAARAKGVDVETVDYELGNVSGAALQRDGYTGRARLVIDRAADTIVGATFAGPDVAELLHAATVAVVGRVPVATLWHAVPSFPTVSEIWLRLLESRAT